MGPLPKRKTSRRRRNNRRSHDGLTLKQLLRCTNCGDYHIAHHICPTCGTYKGEVVMQVKEAK